MRLPYFLILLATIFFTSALAADEPLSRTFDAEGVKIHYLLAGRGQPVVLIHGLYASATMNWQWPGVIAELAKDHQVVALDLPGHGSSDRPQTVEAYGLRFVDDVVLLLDHLKIKQAHIVGYSMGGMVTMKLIATHPERALSATVGGMGWLREGSPLAKFWERIPTQESAGTPSACLQAMGQLALSEDELKQITVPTEIIIGENDLLKRFYVDPLAPIRTDWPIVEIAGAGHITCLMQSHFRDEIARWVRKNDE